MKRGQSTFIEKRKSERPGRRRVVREPSIPPNKQKAVVRESRDGNKRGNHDTSTENETIR